MQGNTFWEKKIENEYTLDLGGNLAPHKIEKTLVERDLGIMISSDLKSDNQTVKATNALKAITAQLRNT